MDTIHIAATESTPEIILDFNQNEFLIKGESYPENVTKCYGEVFDTLKQHLNSLSQSSFTATFELIYFNSSSVKVIMNLFDILDECACNGNEINIIWNYQEEDETIEEFGEEFGEDLEYAKFTMNSIDG